MHNRKITAVLNLIIFLTLMFPVCLLAGEVRTYKEMVRLPITDDEYAAMQSAKQKAKEQALVRYVGEVYPGQSEKLNLGGDDKYIDDIKVLDSKVGGVFTKELTATISVSISEDAVRDYLKRQGTATGKNDERRIFVILIPGKIDSGDAPVVLDNIKAEVRKKLTAAEFTVIDDPEQAKRLERLAADHDYNKIAGELEGLGEWLVLGMVDMKVIKGRTGTTYNSLITAKAMSISSGDLLWEDNITGIARGGADSDAHIGLRASAISGGKLFADKLLKELLTKATIGERMGTRFEVIMKLGGNYKLERKALKMLKEDIKGLKDVSQKQRGKGDLVIDVRYVGRISDLVDLLLDNFEKEVSLKSLEPQINGNKVIFK